MTSPRQRKKRLAALKRMENKKLVEVEKSVTKLIRFEKPIEKEVEKEVIPEKPPAVKTENTKTNRRTARNALLEISDKKTELPVESTDQTVKAEN